MTATNFVAGKRRSRDFAIHNFKTTTTTTTTTTTAPAHAYANKNNNTNKRNIR
jgi:hypothetical protein